MSKRLKSSNHCVYNLGYHLIWIPKCRAKILKGRIKSQIKKWLYEKSKEIDIKIECCEIMPDHIHLFIKCSPNEKISCIVQYLKGYTSFKIREKYPYYKKYKAFWSPSYYCESVGHISENTIKRYINDQWNKVPDSSLD